MTPALILIAKAALIAIAVMAAVVCVWATSRMMKRARESGHRFWLINPIAALAALRGVEPLIYFAAACVVILAIGALLRLFPSA